MSHQARESSVAALLHVEDDVTTQAVVVRLAKLAGRDIEVYAAASVAAALGLLEVMTPDVVLLDMMLPDGLGESVLRALRADGRTRHVPVIVVSSRTNPDVVGRMMDLGADGYLTKPFDIGDILKILRSDGPRGPERRPGNDGGR